MLEILAEKAINDRPVIDGQDIGICQNTIKGIIISPNGTHSIDAVVSIVQKSIKNRTKTKMDVEMGLMRAHQTLVRFLQQ